MAEPGVGVDVDDLIGNKVRDMFPVEGHIDGKIVGHNVQPALAQI
jgi:hypothetical protein